MLKERKKPHFFHFSLKLWPLNQWAEFYLLPRYKWKDTQPHKPADTTEVQQGSSAMKVSCDHFPDSSSHNPLMLIIFRLVQAAAPSTKNHKPTPQHTQCWTSQPGSAFQTLNNQLSSFAHFTTLISARYGWRSWRFLFWLIIVVLYLALPFHWARPNCVFTFAGMCKTF